MLGKKEMDDYVDLIRAGRMDHDKMADMFLGTDAGKSTAVTRGALLAKLHAQFPDTAALNDYLQDKFAALERILGARKERRH